MTVKVWPAIVAVPVRCAVAGFAAMVMLTVPLPVPLAPEVTVMKVELLVAVHGQPTLAVTVMLALTAAAGKICDVGES